MIRISNLNPSEHITSAPYYLDPLHFWQNVQRFLSSISMRDCKFGRSSYSGSDTRHSQEAIALKQACALGSSEPFTVYDTSAPAAIN